MNAPTNRAKLNTGEILNLIRIIKNSKEHEYARNDALDKAFEEGVLHSITNAVLEVVARTEDDVQFRVYCVRNIAPLMYDGGKHSTKIRESLKELLANESLVSEVRVAITDSLATVPNDD